jgi:hypothetical protein
MMKKKKLFYEDIRLSGRIIGIILLVVAILFALGDMMSS